MTYHNTSVNSRQGTIMDAAKARALYPQYEKLLQYWDKKSCEFMLKRLGRAYPIGYFLGALYCHFVKICSRHDPAKASLNWYYSAHKPDHLMLHEIKQEDDTLKSYHYKNRRTRIPLTAELIAIEEDNNPESLFDWAAAHLGKFEYDVLTRSIEGESCKSIGASYGISRDATRRVKMRALEFLKLNSPNI